MKNWISILFVLLFGLTSFGQGFPEGMSYQAQVFSSSGSLLSNTNIGVKFNLRQSSLTGTIVWQETHNVVVNDVGHFSLVVGQGTSTGLGTAVNFSDIDWENGPYFIELLVDELNTNSFISVNTQQLLAVPFAFHAKTTSQEFELSNLSDVDTTGIQIGDILEWNGLNWVPGTDDYALNSDTAQYAYYADSSVYSDTAAYALSCFSNSLIDTSLYALSSDSSNFAFESNYSSYADSSIYADTSQVSQYSIGNWGIQGNDNIDATNFLGTIDSVDLVFRSYDTERMRLKANGKIGIGTQSPSADFHVVSTNGVFFRGTYGSGVLPISGGGTRMLWYPAKAAFRSGQVIGTNWDDPNIGDFSFAAGYNNLASGDYGIAFGNATTASGESSFAAGNASVAQGDYAIAMGQNPVATGNHAVAIGRGTVANAEGAIAIGYHPEVYADYGVGFGNYVKVYGVNGMALGYKSECLHDGSFVYSDYSTPLGTLQTTTANQFMVRASGGTIFYTSSDLSTGVVLPAGGGAWSSLSDRNMKENIEELNPADYLDLLDSIDVYKWNYLTQDDDIQHIGPMAQDFYQVFEIGEDSTMINSIDFDGINLLLLKALSDKTAEFESQELKLREMEFKLSELEEKRQKITLILLDLESKLQEIEQNEIGVNGEK